MSGDLEAFRANLAALLTENAAAVLTLVSAAVELLREPGHGRGDALHRKRVEAEGRGRER